MMGILEIRGIERIGTIVIMVTIGFIDDYRIKIIRAVPRLLCRSTARCCVFRREGHPRVLQVLQRERGWLFQVQRKVQLRVRRVLLPVLQELRAMHECRCTSDRCIREH